MRIEEIYLDRVCGLSGSEKLVLHSGINALHLPARLAVELPVLLGSLFCPLSLSEELLLKIAGGEAGARWAAVACFGERRFRVRRSLESDSVVLDAEEQGTGAWFVAGQGAEEVEERLSLVLRLPQAMDFLRLHVDLVRGAPDEAAFGEHGVERRQDPLLGAERRDALRLLDQSRSLDGLRARIDALERMTTSWMEEQSKRLDPTGRLAQLRAVLLRTEGVRPLSPEEEEMLRRGPAELAKLEEQLEEAAAEMPDALEDAGEAAPVSIAPPSPWHRDPFVMAGLALTVAFTGVAIAVEGLQWVALGNLLSFGGVTFGALRVIQRFEDHEQESRHLDRARERVDALRERRDRVQASLDALRAELGDSDLATWQRLGQERDVALTEYAQWEPRIRAAEASEEWQALASRQAEVEQELQALKAKRAEIPPPDPAKVSAILQRFEDAQDDVWAELLAQWLGWQDSGSELQALIKLGMAESDDVTRERISTYVGKVWCRVMNTPSAEVRIEPTRMVIDGVGSDSWEDTDERFTVASLALKIAILTVTAGQGVARRFLLRINTHRRLSPELQAGFGQLEGTLAERFQITAIRALGDA